MKAVGSGALPISDEYIEEMNFCLDCQACETACPAGVQYGHLVEAARVQISVSGRERRSVKFLRSILLRWLFEKHARLRLAAKLVWIVQYLKLDWFLERSRLLLPVSKNLHNALFLAPRMSSKPSSKILVKSDLRPQLQKHRVAFLTGCIMDVAFAETNVDTVEVLKHHDCEVVIPPDQCCCGSLHAHNGDADTARDLARRNTAIFSQLNVEAIVMNSAGCGAFMKQYGEVLQNESTYAAPAASVAAKIKDLSEFLVQIGPKAFSAERNPYSHLRVTYDDACHLLHSQKVGLQPRKLIKSVPGVEYVELPEADWCCGSAGIYNITHNDSSMKLLKRKIDNVRGIKPNVIITANPGCLLQLQYGLKSSGMDIGLVHLATFLRRAYGI